MATIRLPPPQQAVDPKTAIIPQQDGLVRIFDPTDHHQTATSFRFYGPLKRFDHQRSFTGKPGNDPQRGIYYAALSLEGALIEVFGDSGLVEPGERCVAYVSLARDLRLLDLRGKGSDNGAARAGSVAALASNGDYGPSQAWSSYFFEHPETYGEIDGLLYSNAHNHDDALVLYERSQGALICHQEHMIRLDDFTILPRIQEACLAIRLVPPGHPHR